MRSSRRCPGHRGDSRPPDAGARSGPLGRPGRSRPPGPLGDPEVQTKKRLLVVDDTEFFRELVGSYLEAVGHDVVTASSGAEALQALSAGKFDLVVSDIEMPVMNGWELARAIREHPECSAVPLLALTTLSSDADRTRAKSCGFDGYEVKLDREQFLRTVARLLRGIVPGRKLSSSAEDSDGTDLQRQTERSGLCKRSDDRTARSACGNSCSAWRPTWSRKSRPCRP